MKRHNILAVVLAGFAAMFMAVSAQAMPIEVDYTATDFNLGAPTDPVSGTIIYEAACATADIQSLASINLTIDNHTYSLSEVGYVSFISQSLGALQYIGGTKVVLVA